MRNNVVVLATDLALGVGCEGTLPWPHCPEDLKKFKEITTGKSLLMGRATYEEMQSAGVVWGSRIPYVVTREPHTLAGEGIAINSARAIDLLDSAEPIHIIGGTSLFNSLDIWSNVETVYHTIHRDVYKCDRYLLKEAADYMENAFHREETIGIAARAVLVKRVRRECQ